MKQDTLLHNPYKIKQNKKEERKGRNDCKKVGS
jgi:hypothetical protein